MGALEPKEGRLRSENAHLVISAARVQREAPQRRQRPELSNPEYAR